MNRTFKKKASLFTMFIISLMLVSSAPSMAAEGMPEVSIPNKEIIVNKENGQFSFVIIINSPTAYAGAEFGVICSQGTEITTVINTTSSLTGPTEANGLVWFGFYDGKDSFSGESTIKVEGNYDIDKESAVIIQDIKLYTIGDHEYATTSLEGGILVPLDSSSTDVLIQEETPDNNGINVIMLIICCAVIAVGLACTLIYIKNRKKNRKEIEFENDFEE